MPKLYFTLISVMFKLIFFLLPHDLDWQENMKKQFANIVSLHKLKAYAYLFCVRGGNPSFALKFAPASMRSSTY